MLRPCPTEGCQKPVRPSGRHAGGCQFKKKHCICRVDTTPRIQVYYPGRTGGRPYYRCPDCKRLEFGMPPQTLLVGLVGSTAYGLATSESDHDYLGVFQEPTRNLVGLSNRLPESIVSKNPDKTLHEVGKFMRLALAGNPTVNELLWLDSYVQTSIWGDALVALRTSFLSNKMRNTYGGYAMQQAKRIARGEVESNQRKRIEKHGRHCFRLLLQGSWAIRTGELRVRLSEKERESCFHVGRLAATDPDAFQREVSMCMMAFDSHHSVLPDLPDYEAADELLLRMRNDRSLDGL